MSFEDEWASARGQAAQNVSMKLNHLAPEPGGSGGPSAKDLQVNQDHLGALGSAAYHLHDTLTTDGRLAEESTQTAASMLTVSSFRTGRALQTVHDNWKSQVDTLLGACALISNHLDYSASSHAKEEADIKTSMQVSAINSYFK
ncbi:MULTISPECIES: hypothetical protein [Streptomyces]|uniref:AG1 protein n=1 Tax=Streptomyces montanisoli TaxID=2798581 RepID=A0A940RVU4_9ACTN|nr:MULTISPECIES: hypothetical protein [Streptomyces]MBP0458601.1 hypothetical protein [Streptomyces montanisoli]